MAVVITECCLSSDIISACSAAVCESCWLRGKFTFWEINRLIEFSKINILLFFRKSSSGNPTSTPQIPRNFFQASNLQFVSTFGHYRTDPLPGQICTHPLAQSLSFKVVQIMRSFRVPQGFFFLGSPRRKLLRSAGQVRPPTF